MYRARDLQLGREVALKVLPDSFSHDPDRVARFTREAQVLVSVSNSLSGRHWELDEVPAVKDPTHIVQFGTADRVSAAKGQGRVALQ